MQMRFISCSLLLFIFISVSGQQNFKRAIVVNPNGDTIRGYINDKEWLMNPENFLFKKSVTDKDIVLLDKSNAKYVSIEGYRAYELFIAPVSMNVVRYELYSEGMEPLDIVDTVFMRKLASGNNVNLYSYRDKLKTRFYVSENADKKLSELGYGISVHANQAITLYPYRKQLLNLAEKFSTLTTNLERQIASVPYTGQKLLQVVNRINNLIDEEQSRTEIPSKKTRLFIGAGLNITNLKYRGDQSYKR